MNLVKKEVDFESSFEDRIEDIPFKQYCGVYFLYNESKLVYVGVACNIIVRLWQHSLSKGKNWDSVKFIEEQDYLKAIEIENYYIEKYNPLYNNSLSKLKYFLSKESNKLKVTYPSGWVKILSDEELQQQRTEKQRELENHQKYEKDAKELMLKPRAERKMKYKHKQVHFSFFTYKQWLEITENGEFNFWDKLLLK